MRLRPRDDAELACRRFCHPIRTGHGEIAVRPIGPADAWLAQAFVQSLSSTSRYFRFFMAIERLSPVMLDRFTHNRPPDQVVLVGVAEAQGRPCIVAEARYVLDGDGASADFGIAVADAWQRRGIGAALLGMIERTAAAAGITRLAGETLAVNETFLSFARSCGFTIRRDGSDYGVLRVEKPICAPPRLGPSPR